jgi:hypothetical protein
LRKSSIFILWSCIDALVACGPEPVPPPQKQAQELVIALRPGPTTWFIGPEGVAAGLERDIADQIAQEPVTYTQLTLPTIRLV